jgi:excisionase family DNA binding protein
LVPVGQLLTTQQAADLLNMSRQYLVRLLEENQIPHRKVGRHRRLKIEDVLAYKAGRSAARKSKLAELTQIAEEAGAYDER